MGVTSPISTSKYANEAERESIIDRVYDGSSESGYFGALEGERKRGANEKKSSTTRPVEIWVPELVSSAASGLMMAPRLAKWARGGTDGDIEKAQQNVDA